MPESALLTGPLEPTNSAYAIAKIAGWRLTKAHWEQYGRHYITVNPCNIYGINDNYSQTAHVIPALMRRMWEAQRAGRAPLRLTELVKNRQDESSGLTRAGLSAGEYVGTG